MLSNLPDRILESDEPERGGFAGTCDTTLTDWIQLVQMGRRDAVVSVRTHEGKEGTLWCRKGDIIDAVCDGLEAEAAVYRALSWQGGKVAVDFHPFAHRRRIRTPTTGLLLQAAYLKDLATDDLASPQNLATEIYRPEADEATPALSVTSEFPAVHAPTVLRRMLVWLTSPRPLIVLLVTLGVLSAFLLVWGLSSKSMRPRATTEETDETVAPAEAAVSQFTVRIEVEPTNATIDLDGEQVGVGAFERALPRDGRSHEILCSAPGRVSELLVFRDFPPRRRVILPEREDSIMVVKLPAATLAARAKGQTTSHRAVASATRPATWLRIPNQSRSRGTASARVNPETAKEHPPHVQTIDDPNPRIQIIQEPNARIEMIQ